MVCEEFPKVNTTQFLYFFMQSWLSLAYISIPYILYVWRANSKSYSCDIDKFGPSGKSGKSISPILIGGAIIF